MSLQRLSIVPDGLLDAEPDALEGLLGGPTLLELQGREEGAPTFVATMLHGNEYSGWLAMREVLRRCDCRPATSLSLLIGNPRASALGVRFVDGDFDYNRIWRQDTASPIGKEYMALRDEMAVRKVRAAIDIHNNNAPNPCHAIYMTRQCDVDALDWALGFSGIVVKSTLCQFTCMEAFAGLCPSVTLECGEPGQQQGIDLAVGYVEQALAGEVPVSRGKQCVYDLAARVMLNPGVSVGFGVNGADLTLPADAPRMWNFNTVGKGTRIGTLRADVDDPLELISPLDRKLGDYFLVEDGQLLVADDIVLAMLVARRDIVEQDCLCYVLEPSEPSADRAFTQRSPKSLRCGELEDASSASTSASSSS